MQENPKAITKLIPIFGDVKQLGLGVSDDDKKLLENVSVIFHGAASVRFDDPLKEAILLNTRGTREMLEFASTLKNLEVFLHMSTTYCNADHKVIEEEVKKNNYNDNFIVDVNFKRELEINIYNEKIYDTLRSIQIFLKKNVIYVQNFKGWKGVGYGI